MHRRLLDPVLFLAGLIAVGWIAAASFGTHPLALFVLALIAACYLAGGYELRRYQRATATLDEALAGLGATPADLGAWLSPLHPSLRQAVRLRVAGERVALPAPALTPYLVGLLVLLGMLGTLLGMMSTLRGTGMALESAADLDAIRASLAAPVKGLGFAFGTSIAGVATSALLGLLSALCRRDRTRAVQALDAHIATTLRPHSQLHQREEAFRLLQRQAEVMPALVERLHAMSTALEQQGQAASERQHAQQEAFHQRTEAAYRELAQSVAQSLAASVADSARNASAALQPVMDSTLAALARESSALHASIGQAVQQQLDGLNGGFEASTARVAALWSDALAEHRQTQGELARDLGAALGRFGDGFEQRSTDLLAALSARFESANERTGESWERALARQQAQHEALAQRSEQALAEATAAFAQRAEALVQGMHQSHGDLQAALEARDGERLAAWTRSFEATAGALAQQWQQAGQHASEQQQAVCQTLARTADDIAAQGQAHARETLAEISRLVQLGSEAPRAAAEIIAELRQKLSDSMVRDTAMLDERNRLLATLETLLDAVNHASTEQRSAVDALIGTSADLLDRVGSRFTDHIAAETGKLDTVAARVSAGATEVASLGEVLGVTVQQFGESNDRLLERLQAIEGALEKSLLRSDEQLAYYVAQAREVIDLSMLAQKQIIEDLQQLAGRRDLAGAEAA